ncbi:MAG: hypothetical protein KDA75_17695 [Planctomycetaceae bacterium]|nr:hypothetical protein [Planctomycetaceae bacterium]
MTTSDTKPLADREQQLHDANTCMALGAGLGAFGTGAGMLVGATCPICVVLAPALIGVGAVKRWTASRMRPDTTDQSLEQEPDR